jgi:hypothetical protein
MKPTKKDEIWEINYKEVWFDAKLLDVARLVTQIEKYIHLFH